MNPIYHDDKDAVPRYVAGIWPHKSYPFLYGSLPQTWENSNIKHNFTGYPGDNDPMDVKDISATESVLEKPINDLEEYRPDLKQTFYDWFVCYKVLRSGSLNTIFGDKFQDSNTAREIVGESHGFWQDLISGRKDAGKISNSQTSQPSMCESYIASKDASKEFGLPKKSKIEPAALRPVKYGYQGRNIDINY
ncbi:uncharacterized protein TrAFT101_010619 [Trichoderma asperellum]|uniref:uncharacterized protein n=1 Tax=Trichoderma asperellum TaxID=101201 RepID=UPI003320839D|nr:hypothetical protein TrAFT101_010619 [Trichoderma asperellum]